jgi:hypothetical protein
MNEDKYFQQMFRDYDLLVREVIKDVIRQVLREQLGNKKTCKN